MAVSKMLRWSEQDGQADSSRLVWAFVVSMLLHLFIFGGYYTGKKYNIWQNLHWPSWLQPIERLAEMLKKKPPPQPQQPQDIPLMFVNTSPAQATPEPPKDANFYSDKNTQAANVNADQDTGVPKITGKQTEIVKTEDVPIEKFAPLQPSKPAQPTQQEQTEVKAKPTLAPGDLTLAKPDPNPKKDEGEAPRPRPRRLAEVQTKPQDNRLPGEMMKQEGGVKRHLEIASLDAKATPFGAYDAALVEAIAQCWYGLLSAQEYASDYRGRVVLQFHLHADGRVSDVTVTENTAGTVPGYICQTAIDKPNPYAQFPPDMRRLVGETRSIQFTFYYN
jgi:hypothetical protein